MTDNKVHAAKKLLVAGTPPRRGSTNLGSVDTYPISLIGSLGSHLRLDKRIGKLSIFSRRARVRREPVETSILPPTLPLL
jgi:hypothetical protein